MKITHTPVMYYGAAGPRNLTSIAGTGIMAAPQQIEDLASAIDSGELATWLDERRRKKVRAAMAAETTGTDWRSS